MLRGCKDALEELTVTVLGDGKRPPSSDEIVLISGDAWVLELGDITPRLSKLPR
jgi:hypothetical protein